MKIHETYSQSFEKAQNTLGEKLDDADRSGIVLASSSQDSLDFLRAEEKHETSGFVPVVIDIASLRETAPLFVNRTLLAPNPALDALSPAVITEDPDHSGSFQITRFSQPYDPAVGFSVGMHWQISLKAQTRAEGFGAHPHNEEAKAEVATPFEQGHFGAVILGVKSEEREEDIIQNGDGDADQNLGTHGIIGRGIMEQMAQLQMLPISPLTRPLPASGRLRLYWHPTLQGEDGPVGGDFPDATRLMVGAGLHAIGDEGLERAGTLIDHAVRGA